MLKSSMFAACVLGSVLCAANIAIADDSKHASKPEKTTVPDRACLRDTGSRIPPRPHECSGFGRSYSKEDIDRTGATTLGGALRLLDLAVTIR